MLADFKILKPWSTNSPFVLVARALFLLCRICFCAREKLPCVEELLSIVSNLLRSTLGVLLLYALSWVDLDRHASLFCLGFEFGFPFFLAVIVSCTFRISTVTWLGRRSRWCRCLVCETLLVKSSLHQWSEICYHSVVFLSYYLLAMTMRQLIPATRRLSLLSGELQRTLFFSLQARGISFVMRKPPIGAL